MTCKGMGMQGEAWPTKWCGELQKGPLSPSKPGLAVLDVGLFEFDVGFGQVDDPLD